MPQKRDVLNLEELISTHQGTCQALFQDAKTRLEETQTLPIVQLDSSV